GVACASGGVAAAAYAVTRSGIRRTLAAMLALLALVAAVVLLFTAAGGLLVLGLVVALLASGAGAARPAWGAGNQVAEGQPPPGEGGRPGGPPRPGHEP